MHPKLLIGELYRPQEVDMWALGVTIYFLYYLKYPFQADSGGHGFEVKLLKDMEDKLNSSIPFQDTEKRKISSKLKVDD
jgi:serine/threonine protein kinase